MPNIRSAKKRVKVTARKTAIRRPRLTAMRNAVKRVEVALSGKDLNAARNAFAAAEPVVARAAARGVIRKTTAARKLSRLSIRLKKAGAPPPTAAIRRTKKAPKTAAEKTPTEKSPK